MVHMFAARFSLALMAMISSTAAFAEHGGSLDDQMACTPDVYRLCASQIPNEDAIVACLSKNKATLSQACQKVFSQPDQGKSETKPGDDD